MCAVMLAGCSGSASDEAASSEESSEESEAQTLSVEDMEYYTRFKGQNISINVYNWGEYISTGAEKGTLDVNSEFEIMLNLSDTVGKIMLTGKVLNKEGLPDGIHRMVIEKISNSDRQKLVDYCMSLAS